MNLLLEREVAELLKCSKSTVKRLRLIGALTYIPGRPVKIDHADVLAYVEEQKQRSKELAEMKRAKTERAPSPRVTVEEARKWAMIQILTKRSDRKGRTP